MCGHVAIQFLSCFKIKVLSAVSSQREKTVFTKKLRKRTKFPFSMRGMMQVAVEQHVFSVPHPGLNVQGRNNKDKSKETNKAKQIPPAGLPFPMAHITEKYFV